MRLRFQLSKSEQAILRQCMMERTRIRDVFQCCLFRCRLLLFSFLLFLVLSSVAAGQQPAPQIDPNPLVRPEALVSVSSTDPVGLLNKAHEKVAAAGYEIVRVDVSAGTLEAKRADSTSSKDYDKIILWLERDLREPDRYMKLYLQYGRYEEILAARRDVYRVVVTRAFEDARTAPIRIALIALAATPGGQK